MSNRVNNGMKERRTKEERNEETKEQRNEGTKEKYVFPDMGSLIRFQAKQSCFTRNLKWAQDISVRKAFEKVYAPIAREC